MEISVKKCIVIAAVRCEVPSYPISRMDFLLVLDDYITCNCVLMVMVQRNNSD